MKKRLISTLIAATMVLGITACGKEPAPAPEEPDVNTSISIDVDSETDALLEEAKETPVEEPEVTEETQADAPWYTLTYPDVSANQTYGYGVIVSGEEGDVTFYHPDENYMVAIVKLSTVIPNMQVKCTDCNKVEDGRYTMNTGFIVKDSDGNEHTFLMADEVTAFYTELSGDDFVYKVTCDDSGLSDPVQDISGLTSAKMVYNVSMTDMLEIDGTLNREYKYVSNMSKDAYLVFNNTIGTCSKADYEVYDGNGNIVESNTGYIALMGINPPGGYTTKNGFLGVTIPKDGYVLITFTPISEDEILKAVSEEKIFRISSLTNGKSSYPDSGEYELDGSYELMVVDIDFDVEIVDFAWSYYYSGETYEKGDVINIRKDTKGVELKAITW